MNLETKLLNIQMKLKAPKGQYNAFGKYSYRSCEDIFEAVKPLLNEFKVTLKVSDTLFFIGDRYYIKATAELIDNETKEKIENSGYAREEENKKGMDGSQITGASSSYARKYALNGLFLIDDVKDSDTTNTGNKENVKVESTSAEPMITQNQLTILQKLSTENQTKVCSKFKVEGLQDLSMKQASEVIGSLRKKEN